MCTDPWLNTQRLDTLSFSIILLPRGFEGSFFFLFLLTSNEVKFTHYQQKQKKLKYFESKNSTRTKTEYKLTKNKGTWRLNLKRYLKQSSKIMRGLTIYMFTHKKKKSERGRRAKVRQSRHDCWIIDHKNTKIDTVFRMLTFS